MHLHTSAILICLNSFIAFSQAGYVLKDEYNSQNFFQEFNFFTGDDPTHGYVDYVDKSTAESQGLVSTTGNAIYMGVDSTRIASGRGRSSVRVESKRTYDRGLIITDIEHMPGGICGTWPAFWTVGPNWPVDGEIDILEGVNDQRTNLMVMHTNAGCSITNRGTFTGQLLTPNCDINAPGQSPNAGCSIADTDPASYGAGFNANGGGVFATEITNEAVTMWFFKRSEVPLDIRSGVPYPRWWPKPQAQFSGGCDIAAHFRQQRIIFDTTFCGDWAGNVWYSSSCAAKAQTCQQFVRYNPSAFTEAFWRVNYVRVFEAS
ncbi:hypothetical protein ACJ72_01755 [Emergomyces africanus]|uniref:endo-1,3(4)-beta-glucanase n=1 Tax=Emergomyces africanus TaxID=1955775 RepID=A0A1B7P4G6_9EURO|nr:hypothetical protein ACJ72_01755 [Emergomyces africanus]